MVPLVVVSTIHHVRQYFIKLYWLGGEALHVVLLQCAGSVSQSLFMTTTAEEGVIFNRRAKCKQSCNCVILNIRNWFSE